MRNLLSLVVLSSVCCLLLGDKASAQDPQPLALSQETYRSPLRVALHDVGIRNLPPSIRVTSNVNDPGADLILTQHTEDGRIYRYRVEKTHVLDDRFHEERFDFNSIAHVKPECQVQTLALQQSVLSLVPIRQVSCAAPDGHTTITLHTLVPAYVHFTSPLALHVHDRVFHVAEYQGDKNLIFDGSGYLVTNLHTTSVWHNGIESVDPSFHIRCTKCDIIEAPDNQSTIINIKRGTGALYVLLQYDESDRALVYYRDRPYQNQDEAEQDPDLAAAILSSHEKPFLTTLLEVEQIGSTADLAAFGEVVKQIGSWNITPRSISTSRVVPTHTKRLLKASSSGGLAQVPPDLGFFGISALPHSFNVRESQSKDHAFLDLTSKNQDNSTSYMRIENTHKFSTLDDLHFWDDAMDSEQCDELSSSVEKAAIANVVMHELRCQIAGKTSLHLLATVPVPLTYHHDAITQQKGHQITIDSFTGLNDEITMQAGAQFTATASDCDCELHRPLSEDSLICHHCIFGVANNAYDAYLSFLQVDHESLQVEFRPHISRSLVITDHNRQILVLPANGFVYFLAKPEYKHDFLYYSYDTMDGHWDNTLSSDLLLHNFHHTLYGLVRIEQAGDQVHPEAFRAALRAIGTTDVLTTR